ncbi:isoprenylcysteine carboxyl methyltransferase family protein [Bacillus smithii]|uniref:isoprenylcysteine carboxyl methyltransferase family protein n=1 Tax=Bacillus smithii TaxID=1479 RepID=UPI0022E8D7FB|nr:isoprenylcysteine carboxylmethyltransferase family protein [Bacillus smithii]
MLFFFVLGWLVLQRLIELRIAKRNEKRLIDKGAVEFGSGHYPWMVLLHCAFFLSLLAEVQGFGKTPHRYWIFLLFLFFCLQMARIWIITSLGPYWNTKIIVLKGAEAIKKGPYRWIRHPNYWLVTLELILIPLLFQAYITLFLFFLLNQSMLRIRIRTEEKALLAYTNYQDLLERQLWPKRKRNVREK